MKLREGPLNMRNFVMACRCAPRRARQALKRLVTLGLVSDERKGRGMLQVAAISMTPLGHELVHHIVRMNEVLRAAGVPDPTA